MRLVRLAAALVSGAVVFGGLGAAIGSTPAAAATGVNGRIAYTSWADGDYDIYTMNPDGTDVVNLTNDAGDWDDTTPAWSPDGTKIAFASARAGNGGWDIYVMNADGTNQTQLTQGEAFEGNNSPTWGPNGEQIAFSSTRGTDWDIYVMNADGSNETDITSPHQTLTYDDYTPNWAPDGSRIVFNGVRDGAWEILSVLPDGSDEINLTADDEPAYLNMNGYASFSPDSSKIVYHSQPNNGSNEWDLWVMNADGTNKVDVLPDEEWEDFFPNWSPDGTQITFQSNRSGTGTDVFVMDYVPQAPRARAAEAAGTIVRRLTTDGRSSNPSWGGSTSTSGIVLSATLSGASVVPGPGDPDGSGSVTLTIRKAQGDVCYSIQVGGITLPAAVAHIHKGVAGQAGAVVAKIAAPGAGGLSSGCVVGLSRTVLRDIARNPARYYVDVHTSDYRGGAVRAQLG